MIQRLTLSFVFLFGSALANAQSLPNVLLVITDEHNFRTLGCYREQMPREQAEMWGKGIVVETPHIDAIAKQGVLCTRAYATAPVCSPCRAAMITGRYPQNTGVPANDLVLDRSIPTLADRLNDAGYQTSFLGKWHLGGTGKPEWAPKVDGGFQQTRFMFNRGHWKNFGFRGDQPFVSARKKGKPTYSVDNADSKSFSTDWLTDRAIETIRSTEADKPFFTVISYPDPHGPNEVRAPYDHQFDGYRFSAPRTYQTGHPVPAWLGSNKKHEVFRGPLMSKYFGMVKCIDDNIGRLVEHLRDCGRWDNTLVIFTSDHGDLCFEHDRTNKGNPYEGSARVPMIFRIPGRESGEEVYHQPVGTVDLTPTVIGLLGLPANAEDQGSDLSDQLASASTTSNDNPTTTFLRNAGTKANWVAAVDQRYKLILSTKDEPWLFDADQDPDELLNFYRRPGTEDATLRLGRALAEYSKRNADPFFNDEKIAQSLRQIIY